VRFPVGAVDEIHGRIQVEAVGLEAVLDHPDAAVGHDGALEGLVRLKADDDFLVPVDIARSVGRDGAAAVGGNREDSLLPLFLQQGR